MQISYRLLMWSQYSYERNYPFDFVRECTTKRSLFEVLRLFFIKKKYLVLYKEPVVYWRLEIYIDGYPEVVTSLYRYRSLTRFRSFLAFYLDKAIEYHDLPF